MRRGTSATDAALAPQVQVRHGHRLCCEAGEQGLRLRPQADMAREDEHQGGGAPAREGHRVPRQGRGARSGWRARRAQRRAQSGQEGRVQAASLQGHRDGARAHRRSDPGCPHGAVCAKGVGRARADEVARRHASSGRERTFGQRQYFQGNTGQRRGRRRRRRGQAVFAGRQPGLRIAAQRGEPHKAREDGLPQAARHPLGRD
jgi:hypothetical protein